MTPEQQIQVYRQILDEIADLAEDLPGGIDYEADPFNESPKDLNQHNGGLIWQHCQDDWINSAMRIAEMRPVFEPWGKLENEKQAE